ncbi:hypothetical protein JUJ52_17780 [Virgibacillus sp. AGTR]|uniref:YqeB family protein n=1 Tax=Virgibacillus sp. AGTR TaxID=2812055 RepID=UPI001964E934|nr:50S ribosomal protein L29 [Virgibacillus sp. AGTR]MCC2251797.1 hypothetical protein [Virgibacillus sp. AGTR]QRZ19252.1 50S ribosomal protein L29 [Virgibacillus sp. AGTR]
MLNEETVLGLKRFDKLFIIVISITVGGLLGWFIPVIIDWVLKLPFVPMEGIISIIDSLNHFWVSVVATIVGVIAGIAFIVYVFHVTLKVKVSDKQITLILGEMRRDINKQAISAIFMENKTLIILGENSKEIFREDLEVKKEEAKGAFLYYGYPWKNEDPFIKDYQRWELGNNQYPSDINSILYARERALKEDNEEEAKQLREDLAKLGVVIQDKQKAQYIRLIKQG